MKKRVLLALIVLIGMFLSSASIVWAQPAPVPKTGCVASLGYGADDGYYQKGVALPAWWPRFTDNFDGTVTDNLTGLMWAINGAMTPKISYNDAMDFVRDLELGNAGCGGYYTDWRMPNVKEMYSLVDYGNEGTALAGRDIFTNVGSAYGYWTSTLTPNAYPPHLSLYVHVDNGVIDLVENGWCFPDGVTCYPASTLWVWPVRSAN